MSVKPPTPSKTIRSAAEARRRLEEMYAISDEERLELIEWIGTLDVPVALRKTIAKGTDLETVSDGFCDHCNRVVKLRTPAYGAMNAFIKTLFEYKLSKPDVKRELHVTGRVVHSLDSLTDAELEQVAEGTWEPSLLPPAA